jgi:DNA-binding transcriptional MocR family regulator
VKYTDNSGVGSSGGCPSQFPASALAPMIADGTLEDRIENLKQVYSKRAVQYTAAIKKYWGPFGAKHNPCVGGYFFWIKLPKGITSTQILEEATKEGVWLMSGMSCKVPDDTSVEYHKYIRIALALEEENMAMEGIKRIGKVFERLLKQ